MEYMKTMKHHQTISGRITYTIYGLVFAALTLIICTLVFLLN